MLTGVIAGLAAYLWAAGTESFKEATELGIERDMGQAAKMPYRVAVFWPIIMLAGALLAAASLFRLPKRSPFRSEVHEGCGCVFCDLGYTSKREDGGMVHPEAMGRSIPCTRRPA